MEATNFLYRFALWSNPFYNHTTFHKVTKPSKTTPKLFLPISNPEKVIRPETDGRGRTEERDEMSAKEGISLSVSLLYLQNTALQSQI